MSCVSAATQCELSATYADPAFAQDTETFYDLKKLLEESNAQVPSQLAHHEAAKNKPAAPGEQRRRDQIVYL